MARYCGTDWLIRPAHLFHIMHLCKSPALPKQSQTMIVFTLNREEARSHPDLGWRGFAVLLWMGKHVAWPGIINSRAACPACAFAEFGRQPLGSDVRAAAAHGEARGLRRAIGK